MHQVRFVFEIFELTNHEEQETQKKEKNDGSKEWKADKIRSYAVENFSIEAVAEAYTEAYQIALKSSSE